MELEYVFKAVRRFWPVVVGFLLLGVLGSVLLRTDDTPHYESAALVLVVPPSDSGQSGAEGDRYVASQLVIMRSPAIAERAKELAGVEAVGTEVVTFSQIAGTDVVRVIAVAPNPADAQNLADAYVNAYLERTASASGTDTSEEQTKLDAALSQIEQQLSTVDAQTQEAMKPYTDATAKNPQVSIPAIEQVVPALATQREVLLDTYRSLLQQRNSLEFNTSGQDTSDQIVQKASLPLAPAAQSRQLLRIALPILGLLAGVAAATLLARLSPRVLDSTEVTELLAIPFAGRIPYERSLRSRPLLQIGALRPEYDENTRELCVQAESRAHLDTPLTIAVTGARRVSGATTLAAAMAARFGQQGLSVLLLDLDFEQPHISRCFGIDNDGISALLDMDATTNRRASGLDDPGVFVPTPWRNVRVVGRQPGVADGRPQRADLLSVMRAASRHADVVVLDTGPMLVAPAAAVFSQHAQVVVLTVPVPRLERLALERIAQQLTSVERNVLPVETPALRRSNDRRVLIGARAGQTMDALPAFADDSLGGPEGNGTNRVPGGSDAPSSRAIR